MRKWIVLMAAAALLALPAAGFAAVQDSLHDVDAYTATEGKIGGACAYCHIPHGAAGDKLYKDSIASSTNRWMTATQPVSRICSTCHNATGGGFIVSANRTVAMFNDNAHRDVVATLTNWGDITSGEIAAITGPAMKLSTDSNNLECTSCHDPHETNNRPFLKYLGAAGDIHANCVTCHAHRASDSGSAYHIGIAGGGFASQHPTDRNMTGDNPGDQAENWQATINTAFTTAPVTDNSQTAQSADNYWPSKGKYGLNSTVGCQTCHAIHGVESGSGGQTGTVSFHNQTQKGTGVVVLAMDRTPTAAGSAFCQGCHATDVVTPAGAEHPVNTLETNWRVQVPVASLTYTWTWPTQGADYQIVCETCHDVHFGTDNTASLRRRASNSALDNQAAVDFTSVGNFCNHCHSASPGYAPVFAVGNHHPVSYLKSGANLALDFDPTGGSNIFRDAAPSTINHSTIDWSTRARTQAGVPYTFATLGSDTVMACGTCHGNVGAAGAGAHTLAYPLDTNTESELCVDCHSFNPSTYTLDYEKTGAPALADNSLMTHFVGPIATAGYKRTTSFGGSGLTPKYSSDGGGNGAIICESCHYWRSGNVTGTNLNAVQYDHSVAQDNVYGLIEVAGNNVDLTTADNYMCSGCHGGAPGGGSSHPTRPNNYTSNAGQLGQVTTQITSQTSMAVGRATLTQGNRVNCDSCHRAHNAAEGTGALILEANITTPTSNKPAFQLATDNTGGSELNQEGVCQRCHPQGN